MHSTPQRVYRSGTFALSVVLMTLGLVMIVITVARGGGPLALGVLMGLMFFALGLARLHLLKR